MDPFDPVAHWGDALEDQLSPSSRAPDRDVHLAQYAERSLAARARVPWRTLRYDTGPSETLDYVPATVPAAPLAVVVHGGYWQMLSKDDTLFCAPGLRAQGAAVAVIDYALAPAVPVETIVDQVVRALRYLRDEAPTLGHDPARIWGIGHSAGAQLVAQALHHVSMRGVVLVAGVLDVRPIVGTARNDVLRLDSTRAAALSPLVELPRAADTDAVVCWGEEDTDEFARQSLAWARAWIEAGNRRPMVFESPGRNHFDLWLDLGDDTSPLGAAVADRMGRRP
jgi:arylformamidase